jgi:hypothetical protein
MSVNLSRKPRLAKARLGRSRFGFAARKGVTASRAKPPQLEKDGLIAFRLGGPYNVFIPVMAD